MSNILGSLTMEDLSRIRRMGTADAELFLSRHTLTDEDRLTAMSLIGKDKDRPDYDKVRRHWLAAAWLLGASYRQLAAVHGVARQTVMDIVWRALPEAPSRSRAVSVMSNEKLSHLRVFFNKHVEHLMDLSIHEAAQWLYDNLDYTEGEM